MKLQNESVPPQVLEKLSKLFPLDTSSLTTSFGSNKMIKTLTIRYCISDLIAIRKMELCIIIIIL